MRKKTLSLLIILSAIITFAQSPNSFKYQTVVRDFSGNIMENHNVSFQFSILQGSATGTAVYTETHAVTTNEFGLVNLNIGGGSTSDDFSSIDWGNGPFFIKVELDENGGTAYAEMGTSQLLSVPYAMYANDVANKDDDDADPFNEFQTITKLGNTVTLSDGGGSFIDEVDDADNSATNELQILNFSNDTLYLDNGGQVYLGEYSSLWGQNDTNIFYNNGWVGVGTETPSGMMVVQGDEGVNPDSAIFEVKNKNGQTIFAVYDGGVRIWVDDTGAKANTDKGGFAVGGYRLNKSISSEYLRVTPDSVRVYIREDDGTKANTDKGGFAVGGYRLNKSTTSEYFNINPNLNADTLNPSEARIYWYPLKEAFMSGRVLVESVDSVGLNSWATGFESKSIGDYSQAMGYSARAKGNNSTAIGYYANAAGNNSYAFGNYAQTVNVGSYAIGSGAIAKGNYSFAIGSDGVDSSGVATSSTQANGNYSYAFGMGSVADTIGAFAIGTLDSAKGKYSLSMGYSSKSIGAYSIAMGFLSEAIGSFSLTTGYYSQAIGKNSIAMGYSSYSVGDYSVTLGRGTKATDDYAIATGYSSEANGIGSTAMGYNTNADGDYSFTIGKNTKATGESSFASGDGSEASGSASTAMGYSSTASGGSSTALGWACTASSGAATAMGSGSVASGNTSLATGSWTKSSGNNTTTMGMDSEASGEEAFALGKETKATGNQSVASGYQTIASDLTSTAIGYQTRSNAFASFASGRYSKANGIFASAFGLSSFANSLDEFVVGQYNDTSASTNASSWVTTDALFVVGNGTSSARHNAMTVLKNGNVGIGTTTPMYNVHIVGSSTLGSLLISPNETGSEDNSELILAEDNDYTYGMSLFYDGGLNQLQVKGKSGTTNYGPWLTISRDYGEITMPAVYSDVVGSTNRDLYIDNTGKIGYLSSARRFKKHIKTMENVDWLYKLRPVNYLYKTDKNGIKQYGLIAEEVEAINPLFVSYNKEGVIETVNYSQFITPMIKVIQEQKLEITKLQQENIAAKTISTKNTSEIEQLKAEIEQLKQILEIKAEK